MRKAAFGGNNFIFNMNDVLKKLFLFNKFHVCTLYKNFLLESENLLANLTNYAKFGKFWLANFADFAKFVKPYGKNGKFGKICQI